MMCNDNIFSDENSWVIMILPFACTCSLYKDLTYPLYLKNNMSMRGAFLVSYNYIFFQTIP